MLETSQRPSLDDFAHVENGAIAGRYLANYWQPIAIAAECKPGAAQRIKILGNHYTLFRGTGGVLNLVQDRCPHRGTSLAYGWVEDNCIRCRYRGWKFAGTGEGVDFPAESESFTRSISLQTYPVREYLGVAFGFFGDGEPPELPRFPELEDESAGELLSMAVVLPYNYFQRVENDVDEVHIHFTHKDFVGGFGLLDIPRITAQETEYGMLATAARADGTKLFTHVIMPNIMLRDVAIQQDRTNLTIHAAWCVPIDDIDMEHPLLPVIQDTVTMGGQGLIADRNAEHLGASDRAIALLRRIWKREMNALRDGKPLTEWARSGEGKLITFEAGDA